MKKKTILIRNVSEKVLKVSDRLTRYMGMTQAQAIRFMMELGATQLLKTRKPGSILLVLIAIGLQGCGKLGDTTSNTIVNPTPSHRPVAAVLGCYYDEAPGASPKIFSSYSVVEYTDGTTSSECYVYAVEADNSQENSYGKGTLDCSTSSVTTAVNGQWFDRGTLLVRGFVRTGRNTATNEGNLMGCTYNLNMHPDWP